MNYLSGLLDSQMINALGWSILHILWQGFIVAFILGFALRILHKKSSQLKYLLSVSSILLIVGLSVYNFISYSDNKKDDNLFINKNVEVVNGIKINPPHTEANHAIYEGLIIDKIKAKITSAEKFFPLMVNIWLIGVLVFVIKLILSIFYTSRFKYKYCQSISAVWLKKFNLIEEKLMIEKAIQYIESGIVKTPIVLGYFKPAVIIPVGMLTGIPENQIEAIIAHELAHIRRNDYIINVIQTIIETVFFFHPAVWYISSKIRNERENCCDDIAIKVCDGNLTYAKALVSIQEFSLGKHYAAVAFSGQKKHLLNRIKRIVMKPKMKSGLIDKLIALFIIVSAAVALSFTYKNNNQNFISETGFSDEVSKSMVNTIIKEKPSNDKLNIVKAESIVKLVKDTVKIKKHSHDKIEIENKTIICDYKENGVRKEMKFTLKNGKVEELYVDGKKIPESEYPKYQKKVDETIADLKDAKEDIREAMEEIEEIDFEKIQFEIQESIKDIHIDMEETQKEIAESMKNIEKIDVEELMKEIELEISQIKDIDLDIEDINVDIDVDEIQKSIQEAQKAIQENIDLEEIRVEMEKVRQSIQENIDSEKIKFEIQKAQEELANMDMEEIRKSLEENARELDSVRKKEVIEELEQKLEELENLELEEK